MTSADSSNQWYIVQTEAGQCEICPAAQLPPEESRPGKTWGPFESQGDAIARRVGLIRAGQCKPA